MFWGVEVGSWLVRLSASGPLLEYGCVVGVSVDDLKSSLLFFIFSFELSHSSM